MLSAWLVSPVPLFLFVSTLHSRLGSLRACLAVGRACAEVLYPSLRHDPLLLLVGMRTLINVYVPMSHRTCENASLPPFLLCLWYDAKRFDASLMLASVRPSSSRYHVACIACVALVNMFAAWVAQTPSFAPLRAWRGLPGAAVRGILVLAIAGVALPIAHVAMRFAR